MARFEIRADASQSMEAPVMHADILFDLGVMYATGRDCPKDLVAAHKWLNIAAINGCEEAVEMRSKVAAKLRKGDLARALQEARAWMTMH